MVEQFGHPGVKVFHFLFNQHFDIALNLLAEVADGRSVKEVLFHQVEHIVGCSQSLSLQSILHSLVHFALFGLEFLTRKAFACYCSPYVEQLLHGLMCVVGIGNNIPCHLRKAAYEGRKTYGCSDKRFGIGVFKTGKTAWSQGVEYAREKEVARALIGIGVVRQAHTLVKTKRGALVLLVNELHVQRLSIVADFTEFGIVGRCLLRKRREGGFDGAFGLVEVYVSYDSYELQLRSVPRIVESAHVFGREGA